MTESRAEEIVRKTIYVYADRLMRDLEGCEDTHSIFMAGWTLGCMHKTLSDELEKEIEHDTEDKT